MAQDKTAVHFHLLFSPLHISPSIGLSSTLLYSVSLNSITHYTSPLHANLFSALLSLFYSSPVSFTVVSVSFPLLYFHLLYFPCHISPPILQVLHSSVLYSVSLTSNLYCSSPSHTNIFSALLLPSSLLLYALYPSTLLSNSLLSYTHTSSYGL